MMKKIICLVILTFLFLSNGSCKNKDGKKADRMCWWREARFGMFIHWGLYSIPGEWDGSSELVEWALWGKYKKEHISRQKYEGLVTQFNPVKFNADEWVSVAKEAGMKYIVITSKHHDGFCLFDSKETDYDIMSTPFKRDILKELSDACARQGITLCFYYSILDWNHPDYLPRMALDDRQAAGADFEKYVSNMKTQLKELLTNYGRIGVLWFDGEWDSSWTHERGKDLYGYLRTMRPGLIINNRVDKGRKDSFGMTRDTIFYGDFGTPEQVIPSRGLPGVDWESCMTMNNSWGYNKNAKEWKSSEDLIRKLIDVTSKGGNFLLNIGPTSGGLFPDDGITRLKDIGAWMKENRESVYGTMADPFENLEWGRCTQKEKDGNTNLYLHVFDWPKDGKLIIPGLTNKIVRAYALNDRSKKKLDVEKTKTDVSVDVRNITQSNYATVIVLVIKGKPVVTMMAIPLTDHR